MKKIYLVSIGIFIMLLMVFVNFNVNSSLEASSDVSLLSFKKAFADPSEGYNPPPPSTGYIIYDKDCTIEVTGEIGTTIKIFGRSIPIGSNGKATLRFTNVARDCESGGRFSCTPYTCAQFWGQQAQ